MGSSFSPDVANLFMANLEDNYIFNVRNPFCDTIFFFVCFIDDIFCVYSDPDSVHSFVEWLNGIHPSIKFTLLNHLLNPKTLIHTCILHHIIPGICA